MEYAKDFFEKVFSDDRMGKYFLLYPEDEGKAIKHYQCNIMLSEAMYPCLSVFEVELRNSVVRELKTFAQREDWYVVFSTIRNRIDHNEAICWNLSEVEIIHDEMLNVMGWMNKDVPVWLGQFERFSQVCKNIREIMDWEK